MDRKKLEKIILNNIGEVNQILKENEEAINFFKINDIIKNITFNELSLKIHTHTVTRIQYYRVYSKLMRKNLKTEFYPLVGSVDMIDTRTELGKKLIVNELKKKWVKFVKRHYPEYVHLTNSK